MKRTMFFLMLLSALITAVYIVDAATLSWQAPTTYTDGSNIISADAVNIVYYPYTGMSASGPWTSYPYTALTSCTMPEPDTGATLWYTVESDLRGSRSEKAAAVSKTVNPPGLPQVPVAPSILRVV